LTLSEDSVCYRREIRDITEESIEEAWNINVKRRVEFIPQRAIKVFPVLGRIDEAARVEGDWGLYPHGPSPNGQEATLADTSGMVSAEEVR
jgi:hypothetical protein